MEEAVRRAHNVAFADHWGAIPKTPERWADQQGARSFHPTMSPVTFSTDSGLDPAESVDGYALCGQWGEGELHVSLPATRGRARHEGLAAAFLEGSWRQRNVADTGCLIYRLTPPAPPVQAASTSAGFKAVLTWTVYRGCLD